MATPLWSQENKPSEVTGNEANFMEFMPFFTLFRTYSAPACTYITPCCEYVLLSFRLGIIRILFTTKFQKKTFVWKLLYVYLHSNLSEEYKKSNNPN